MHTGNVHDYDSRLKNNYKQIYKESTLQSKINTILDIKNYIHFSESKQMIDIIVQSMQNIPNQNFQIENNIDASDILYDICCFLTKTTDLSFKEGILTELDQQLYDTFKSGQCPSGRVTRLLQIYQLIF